METSKIKITRWDGIHKWDAPDYVDMYADSAYWIDTEKDLSDNELDKLNDESWEFVYEEYIKQIN